MASASAASARMVSGEESARISSVPRRDRRSPAPRRRWERPDPSVRLSWLIQLLLTWPCPHSVQHRKHATWSSLRFIELEERRKQCEAVLVDRSEIGRLLDEWEVCTQKSLVHDEVLRGEILECCRVFLEEVEDC